MGRGVQRGTTPKNIHRKPPIYCKRPPPPPPQGGLLRILGFEIFDFGISGGRKILAHLISCSLKFSFGLNFFTRV